MEFHFRRHFRLRPKMKNAFRSASSIHHKKVLVLVLKKSIDYITGENRVVPGLLCSAQINVLAMRP